MTSELAGRDTPSVAVVGGGLAGLAATVAPAARGFRVEVFEARRRLGGRAGSFWDAQAGEWIDHCQHVALGCCTNLADFCQRNGVADAFVRCNRLHFIDHEGTRHDFAPAPGLPAPLHLGPAILRLRYLRPADRLAIARAVVALARGEGSEASGATVGDWLRRRGPSREAIEGFWSVVLVSALSESLDRASLAAARQVFVEGFLASTRACALGLPAASLAEIYDCRIAASCAAQGVEIHRSARVCSLEGDAERATTLVLADGSRRRFDSFVLAVPWRVVGAVLGELLPALPALGHLGHFEGVPITAVHLWYDRPITPLPHAVLVGRLGQWVFRKSTLDASPAAYYQVVISASRELRGVPREAIASQVRGELEEMWPEARRARLLRWKVITEPEAVFSPAPGLEPLRPAQQTPIANLALAGDWTATGWPATMEGAVRSGYLAAEALLRSRGDSTRLLVADLPRSWLTRRLIGRR